MTFLNSLPKPTLLILTAALVSWLSATAIDAQRIETESESESDAATMKVFVVEFDEPSLLHYQGEIEGLPAPTRTRRGNRNRLETRSWQSQAYLAHVAQRHEELLDLFDLELGRTPEVQQRYRVLRNGMALELTQREADRLATLPGVRSVVEDSLLVLQAQAGTSWVGSEEIWNGNATGGLGGNKGAGVIVGVIDTGVNSDHPSFSDTPPDGHTYTNPLGDNTYVGACSGASPTFTCNEKLIGAWDFADASGCEADGPEDDEGHGSHVASIAVGNTLDFPAVSGVAPHANLIVYDACYLQAYFGTCPPPGGQPQQGVCAFSATLAAADQAVIDQVDVLNISIAGGQDPWNSFDINSILLDAHDAGLLTVASAGNSGPTSGTVGHAAPWVLTVGASTHDRVRHEGALSDLSGDGTPPSNPTGATFNDAVEGPHPIVFGGDYAANIPSEDPVTARGCNEPFDPGTFSNGEIVVCDYYGIATGPLSQLVKGQNVADGGGSGMILLVRDHPFVPEQIPTAYPHSFPTIELDKTPSSEMLAWVQEPGTRMGTIGSSTTILDTNQADRVWDSSSIGPLPNLDVLKPDLVAPGVQILAADGDYYTPGYREAPFNWRTGTSMSSPHVAGAAALLMSLHPDWSPSEVKSALMTTAAQGMVRSDGTTPADAFETGSGRLELRNAARAGLLFDETAANYQAADPGEGGDPTTLNLPSMLTRSCTGSCAWNRTVKSSADSTVTWTATVQTEDNTAIDVSPITMVLDAAASQSLDIQARLTAPGESGWRFASVTLTPDVGSIPSVILPVVFFANGGVSGDLMFDNLEYGDFSLWSTIVE